MASPANGTSAQIAASSPSPSVASSSPSPLAAASSSSSSSAAPAADAAAAVPFHQLSSAERYPIPAGYDLSLVANPCAHIAAAPIVPLKFDQPRKAVNYQDGWDYYRRIGSPKTVCAPMVNQSELAFRLLCRRYNTQVCYTPMFHAEIFGKDPKYREDAMQFAPQPGADRPLVVQFCGNDPQLILKAAKLVEKDCDAVDLNCGSVKHTRERNERTF